MAPTALFLNPGADLGQALELARRADALGYESLWVTHGVGRDALLVLSAYAQAAPRVGLGTGIVPIYPRHPVLLAQEALTLAESSGGLPALRPIGFPDSPHYLPTIEAGSVC